MATILQPDKKITLAIGGMTLEVNQKIIPDGLRAAKDVASYVLKGQPMKPRASIGAAGKPLGITVHNTEDIKVAAGTNAAEQYTRATYNGNMRGVVVHYYVWKNEIWQNLRLDERGWHAADGKTRRAGRRPGQKIGGNLDTVAIEAIGPSKDTEDTTAQMCAWLCREFNLDPALDIWQHYDFSRKNCPAYIRPHWGRFIEAVQGHLTANVQADEQPVETIYTIQSDSDTLWSLAQRFLGNGSRWMEISTLNGNIDPKKLHIGMDLKIPASEGSE